MICLEISNSAVVAAGQVSVTQSWVCKIACIFYIYISKLWAEACTSTYRQESQCPADPLPGNWSVITSPSIGKSCHRDEKSACKAQQTCWVYVIVSQVRLGIGLWFKNDNQAS